MDCIGRLKLIGLCQLSCTDMRLARNAVKRIAGGHDIGIGLRQNQMLADRELIRRLQLVGVDDRAHRDAGAPRNRVQRIAALGVIAG
jgi:hypothetical protein